MKRITLNETHKDVLENIVSVVDGLIVNKRTKRVYGSLGKNGYLDISIKISDKYKVRAYAHRLIFLLTKGYLPECIDHIDGNKLNNNIANLRDVDQCVNGHNSRLCKNNVSGFNGVYFDTGRDKWGAKIRIYGVDKGFKRFSTIEEAITHRKNLEEQFKDVIKKPQEG